MMRSRTSIYCLVLLAVLTITSCTKTVPDYSSAQTGELSPWIDLYGDTTKDMSVSITYSDGKVVASFSGYSSRDSMNFLQDIDVSIAELDSLETELQFCFGPFPGTQKVCHSNAEFTVMSREINMECDTMNCDQIHFAATRTYSIAENDLPDLLSLRYSVKTIFGTGTGGHPFLKVEREVEETMRIH